MLIDKKHKSWIVFVLVALAAATAYYYVYREASSKNGGEGPKGSTYSGMAYGLIGFLMMVFCGLLGARRSVRVWRLGRARDWLRAHIWLGLLAFPLILFHSGFLLGHEMSLTFWAMILFIIVEVTGILGVFLQQYIPSFMLDLVKNESTFEQIPEVIRKLKYDAAVITSVCCGKITGNFSQATLDEIESKKAERLKKDTDFKKKFGTATPSNADEEKAAQPLMTFYVEQLEPFLDPRYNRSSKLAEVQKSKAVFKHIQTLLPEKLHVALDEIQLLCEERRQLRVQVNLHRALHLWEYAHIPLSYLLLALSLFHVVIATWSYSGLLNK